VTTQSNWGVAPEDTRQRYRLAVTVGFTAFATLLFELTQTRILSYIFWNHIVYLTVSLALLGFGISGTLVALIGSRRSLFSPRLVGALLTGFGASSFGAIVLTSRLLPRLELSGWSSLLFCYVAYVVPFIFAGAVLTIILSSSVESVGSLYSIDLLSAGLGCILFFFLLPLLGAPVLVCVLSVGALLIGLAWTDGGDRTLRLAGLVGAVAVTAVAIAQWASPSVLDFAPVANKEMGVFQDEERYPNARIEQTTWTPIGRIDVVGDDEENLYGYGHPKGSYKIITQDGTAHTRLLSDRAIDAIEAGVSDGAVQDPTALAYRIKPSADVAVIGVGGGIDVAKALAYGAQSVYGVELNPATYRYLSEEYADYTGNLLDDPRVTVVNAEGRSAMRSTDREFDVIQVIAIDTFAALSSGAYVLSENYLYTVEAFEDLFDRLKPGGVLAYYRWLFIPPRETLRLSSLACEAWQRQGIDDCDQRIMVIGGRGWALSLFKNEPFTPEEAQELAGSATDMGRWVFYWPKVFGAEQGQIEETYYAGTPDRVRTGSDAFNGLISAYSEGREEEFFDSYQYNVAPTTDDSPFFFEYHRLNRFGFPTFFGGHTSYLRSNNVGSTLFMILAEATVLSLLAIFWPLWRYQRTGLGVPHAAAYSLYFAALGFGFMMIEIGMVQKSVLLLGNPLYALPVVLATLLVSAGAGSRLVAQTGWTVRQTTGPVALVFLGLVGLLILGATPLFRSMLDLPFSLRTAAVVVVLIPLGILMGTFFPTGLRAVGAAAGVYVPWAWGINGCASVYGCVAAILVAMVAGFNATLAVGAAVYAGGFVAAQWFSREARPVVVTAPASSD
jgi:hypothetical protein